MAAVAGMRPLRHDPDAGVALTRLPDEPRPREWSGARTPTVVPIRRCRQQFPESGTARMGPIRRGPLCDSMGRFQIHGPTEPFAP